MAGSTNQGDPRPLGSGRNAQRLQPGAKLLSLHQSIDLDSEGIHRDTIDVGKLVGEGGWLISVGVEITS